MDSLIFISPFVNKFLAFFQYIFVSERKATQYNLLLLVLGIAVTSCLSVRKCFRHVASRLSDKSLNSFYYLMFSGKISLNIWSTQIIKLALRCILPAYEEAPILLAVDDTLVEKRERNLHIEASSSSIPVTASQRASQEHRRTKRDVSSTATAL